MEIQNSVELHMLGLSVLLGIAHLVAVTGVATMRFGLAWNLSPRDERKPELTGMAGRLDRSFKNFKETFSFFVAAIVGVQLLNHHGILSQLGSEIYFGCRLIYIPIYVAGIPGLRTLIWTGSMIGLCMVLAQQLVF